MWFNLGLILRGLLEAGTKESSVHIDFSFILFFQTAPEILLIPMNFVQAPQIQCYLADLEHWSIIID